MQNQTPTATVFYCCTNYKTFSCYYETTTARQCVPARRRDSCTPQALSTHQLYIMRRMICVTHRDSLATS